MPITTAILRIFVALILSTPIFSGLAYYLAATATQDTLLDPDVVTSSIARSGVYDRVHRDVFLRQEFDGWTDSLVGGFQVPDDTKVQLLKGVVPASYVEAETERNVSRILGYLNGSDDDLRVFVDLDRPLEQARPAVFAFLDQRIEELEPAPASSTERLPEEIASFLVTVSRGQMPPHLPTAQSPDSGGLVQAYRQSVDTLEREGSLSPAALANLKAREPAITAAIQESGLREALKLASRAVATPRIDREIASIRQPGGAQDRLDLVDKLAEGSNRTPAQVLQDAGILRTLVQAGTGQVAQWTALGLVIVCTLGMAALFIPYWKHVVFWPSATLLASGLLIMLFTVSTTLESSSWASAVCDSPGSAFCQLTLDIAWTIAEDNLPRFGRVAMLLIAIGTLGVMLSFIVSRVSGRKAS